jgi:hypothetical protein
MLSHLLSGMQANKGHVKIPELPPSRDINEEIKEEIKT